MKWLKSGKCIRITCNNELECVEVQKLLFRSEYKWVSDLSTNIFNFDEDEFPKNLYCNYIDKSTICHGIKFKTEKEDFVKIYKKANLILRKYKLEKIYEI
jgi:hypothetical protein